MFKNIKYIKQYLFWLFLFVVPLNVNAQNDIKIQSLLDSADVLKEIKPLIALKYGFEAKSLAEQGQNSILLASSLQKIAITQRILGDLFEAEKTINKAIQLQISDYKKVAEIYNTKGVILKQMSRFDEALECYNTTLLIQKFDKNKKGEARTYNNIGRIYEAMELYDDALFYYNKAIQIYKTLKITKSLGITLQNVGHIYRANNDNDSALYYFQLALPLYQKEDNQILIAYAYRSIASVTKNSTKAIDYLSKSIDITKNLNVKSDLAKSYIELGEIYYRSQDYNIAIPFLKDGVTLFTKKQHKNVTRDALKMLYSSYDSIGDFKNAYQYQSIYYQLQDSIKSENNMIAMQQYEATIKLKEKQNENKIQQIEIKNTNEKLRIEHQQNTYFLIGVVILGLLLLIVILQVIKQKKNNRLLNHQKSEIEKKDKEKEVLIREIHHRVKNNLQIISSLLKLDQRKTDNTEVKVILNKSTQRIEAIAYIHEKLYQQNDLTDVDIEEYLFDIGESLLLSFDKLNKVELNIKANVTDLHADVAINLGMLTAELITNSIKHGFTESLTDFKITLVLENKAGLISFSYADNGKQIIDFNDMERPKSFGMNLIKSIIKKLHGKPIINSNLSGGFNLMFNFKVHE